MLGSLGIYGLGGTWEQSIIDLYYMYMISEIAVIFGPVIGGLLIKLSIFHSALITFLMQFIGLCLAVVIVATLDKKEKLKVDSSVIYKFNVFFSLAIFYRHKFLLI